MVVASPNPSGPRKPQAESVDGLPVIDLSGPRSEVSKLIVKACEEYGFFKVINHGVPESTISAMEEEGLNFFSRPVWEKQRAGPASPFGYGCKNIGLNGDLGEVEYILLHTNPLCVSQTLSTISTDPVKFSSAVRGYVEAVKEVAGEVLKLMAEGLWVPDTSVFSRLIMDAESDSVFRLNHYPPNPNPTPIPYHPSPSPSPSPSLSDTDSTHHHHDDDAHTCLHRAVGFGEHSDPQILTILRSNNVPGLQICLDGRLWLPVTPDPTAFCVNVGDLLQAMTNGRFVSVRHRALTNPHRPRMSMAYFAAPPLHAPVAAVPNTVTPFLYRPFTWAEYKKATYSLRLGDDRLDLFRYR